MEYISGPINLWINKAAITDLTFKMLQNSAGCPIFTQQYNNPTFIFDMKGFQAWL